MSADDSGKVDDSTPDETLQVSFKAVRKDLIRDLEHVASPTTVTSRVQVLDIVDHIRQACEDIGAASSENDEFVEEKPIISLAEAKAQVSFLDKLNYEVKVSKSCRIHQKGKLRVCSVPIQNLIWL